MYCYRYRVHDLDRRDWREVGCQACGSSGVQDPVDRVLDIASSHRLAVVELRVTAQVKGPCQPVRRHGPGLGQFADDLLGLRVSGCEPNVDQPSHLLVVEARAGMGVPVEHRARDPTTSVPLWFALFVHTGLLVDGGGQAGSGAQSAA